MGESSSRAAELLFAARNHRDDPVTWEARAPPRTETGGGRLIKTQVEHVGLVHVLGAKR